MGVESEKERMRRARIKVDGEGFYHVVSRIGGRRFLLDDAEKGILLEMIRAAAAFSGVEVYTYALMDNHFHLLIRVPPREEVSDEELERRVRALYGTEKSGKVFGQWSKWEATGDASRVAEAKQRLRARMHDLSQFCKTFKEAYTQDYNRRHGNTGTIWEGRFKSILLEGSYRALMAVGGYIHLNPVRAEMAEEPEEARNTGFGAGCAGDLPARRGLEALVSRALGGASPGWEVTRNALQDAMDGALARDGVISPSGEMGVGSPDGAAEEESDGKSEAEADASPHDLLRHRCSGFLHGGALGRSGFLQSLAGLVPPRRRKRPEGELDRRLGLSAALGVREAS
jgi:REP element-mobilizing transposase RayT